MSTPMPPPLITSVGRHSVRLYGDVILLLRPAPFYPRDADIVRLEINVNTACPYPSRPPHDYGNWFRPVEFVLNRLPDLREMIDRSVPTLEQSVIAAGEDYDVFDSLAHLVTVYLTESMIARMSTPRTGRPVYNIRAFIEMPEPVQAVFTSMLRKVTYHVDNGKEATSAAQVLETSCPICLQEFEEGEEVHLTPCEHPFHLVCLERWLRRKAECPLCRSAMT